MIPVLRFGSATPHPGRVISDGYDNRGALAAKNPNASRDDFGAKAPDKCDFPPIRG